MAIQDTTVHNSVLSSGSSWLDALLPALKSRWNEQFQAEPAPIPLGQWTSLLQTAVAEPDRLPARLVEVKQTIITQNKQPRGLPLLTDLFELTIDAARSVSDRLGPEIWATLLSAQNRIWRSVNQLWPVSDNATAPAASEEHYRKILAELNKTNNRLKATLQHYRRANTLLYESIAALGANLDLDAILHLMTQKITQAVEAGGCVICQFDPDSNTVTALAQYIVHYPGNPDRIWRPLNQAINVAQDPVARQILKTKRPVIGRVAPKKSVQPPPWSLLQSSAGKNKPGWGTLFALPLELENRVVGLLEIYHKSPTFNYSNNDIQLIRVLATQTIVAMEHARMYTETRQRLTEVATLYTMAREIAGELDLQALLDHIVVTLRQTIGCRGCCIFLLDQDSQYLEIKAADGLKPHWRKHARLRLGEGVAGRAAAEGRVIYVQDTHKQPDFIFFDEEVRSLLSIPLFAHGEVIGTINVDDSHPNAFDKTQERLLTIAATQAGIIIDNARLFARISAEKQQTQAIIQHMADGLLLINQQGVIVTCNQTLAIMLGLHTGQIIGQNIHSPDLPPNLARVIQTAGGERARTGVLATEVDIEPPRSKTLKIFSTPVFDHNHRPMGEVRVIHDITKERELEELKDNFFSTISHELRTPLFSIQGFAQILLEEKNLDPATRDEFLETIRRQAEQLSEMVNNLLDLSRFDKGKIELQKEPVDIPKLIHQTILKLQGYAHQAKVHLYSELPTALPTVIGDRQRLEQVLTNLIGNAIKFSHQGGQVLVRARTTATENQVEVQDEGIGIAPEELDRIFDPYYQAEQNGERTAMGTGLGLYISKKIIEEHGGRIWAESTSGQGSTFYFALPLPASSSRLPGY